MKKVLYVFGGEEASGAELVIQRLIQYNKGAVDAHLFVAPGQFAEQAIKNKLCEITLLDQLKKLNRGRTEGIGFIIKALKNYIAVSAAVLNYVKRNKIEIVHANTVVPASYLLPAIFFSKLTFRKTKWIWSDHDIKYFSRLDHLISNWCLRFYNATLVVSIAVKKKFNPNKSNIIVLYNGIDLNQFNKNNDERRQFRQAHNIKDDELLFCIAGVISPRKGQLSLIKAFGELLSRYDNIKLVFAGSLSEDTPDYYRAFLDAVNQHSDKITYIGKVSNMLPLYNGIDVLINNSSAQGSEPLGTTILEAMAFEKIVAATNLGGSPEIISDKENGFLYGPDDNEELKNIIETIIIKHNSFTDLRVNARLNIKHKFDIEQMAINYNKIINSIS
ncbi:glycosyltransferase family 4 protein [Mucilaginibacter sp. dw_454]|uniref:glycosyltransferase family 4 protein n=1 Tax=Mucilaginibacter sp. dw_454 TaxID=2720079 RepID=UPI001BD4296D|nr:glycosyltransferase family 4 protein [Mucilaginibacter sp. dw_454]